MSDDNLKRVLLNELFEARQRIKLLEAQLAVVGAAHVDVSVPFRVAKAAHVAAFDRGYLTKLLEESGGNLSKAARMAGMGRMYLHRLARSYGLRQERRDESRASEEAA